MSKDKKKNSVKKQAPKRTLPSYLIAAIVVCAVLAVATVITAIIVANREPRVEFIPPSFEENAVKGTPDVPDDLGYTELYQEGMAFSAWCCGVVHSEDGQAVVYFTNPKDNDAWLKLRICDESGAILGESGLLKPGEYVRAVTLTEDVPHGTALKMRIMSYEPDTYYSLGAVTVRTNIIVQE